MIAVMMIRLHCLRITILTRRVARSIATTRQIALRIGLIEGCRTKFKDAA